MSTVLPATPVALVARSVEPQHSQRIRIYGHTNLFYWWPVWLVGFVLAGLTYVDGHVMAVVPAGTTVEQNKIIPGDDGPRDVLVAPPGQSLPVQPKESAEQQPRLRVANNNNYGVVFIATILFVIVVTNILVRGLASIIVIAGAVILALVFAQFHLWDAIFLWVGGLDVRMNAGGYLALAVPLFLVWLFTVFFYDRYTYLTVTHGQVTIRQAIGDGEIAVDTTSLMFEKRRNDFFRHWLLGFGAGDLHVKTGGAANLDLELNNVLFVGQKLVRIQEMIREKEVSTQEVLA